MEKSIKFITWNAGQGLDRESLPGYINSQRPAKLRKWRQEREFQTIITPGGKGTSIYLQLLPRSNKLGEIYGASAAVLWLGWKNGALRGEGLE